VCREQLGVRDSVQPAHGPEVVDGVGERRLGDDEATSARVRVDVHGADVVVERGRRARLDGHVVGVT